MYSVRVYPFREGTKITVSLLKQVYCSICQHYSKLVFTLKILSLILFNFNILSFFLWTTRIKPIKIRTPHNFHSFLKIQAQIWNKILLLFSIKYLNFVYFFPRSLNKKRLYNTYTDILHKIN